MHPFDTINVNDFFHVEVKDINTTSLVLPSVHEKRQKEKVLGWEQDAS